MKAPGFVRSELMVDIVSDGNSIAVWLTGMTALIDNFSCSVLHLEHFHYAMAGFSATQIAKQREKKG